MNRILILALLAAVFGILIFGSLNAISSAVQRRTPAPAPTVAAGCRVTGCSSQLCVDSSVGAFSTCEYKVEYACYASATCERQPTGQCGWTPTTALVACLQRSANTNGEP